MSLYRYHRPPLKCYLIVRLNIRSPHFLLSARAFPYAFLFFSVASTQLEFACSSRRSESYRHQVCSGLGFAHGSNAAKVV